MDWPSWTNYLSLELGTAQPQIVIIIWMPSTVKYHVPVAWYHSYHRSTGGLSSLHSRGLEEALAQNNLYYLQYNISFQWYPANIYIFIHYHTLQIQRTVDHKIGSLGQILFHYYFFVYFLYFFHFVQIFLVFFFVLLYFH